MFIMDDGPYGPTDNHNWLSEAQPWVTALDGCLCAYVGGEDDMSRSIILGSAASMADLAPSPICASWIHSGKPEARSKLLAKSHDGTAYVVVWECTAGRFEWHYLEDETVTVISGEVYITTENGERRLGQGDMAFFPAGCSCEWRVPDRVRKVAVMRKSLGYPLGFGVRALYKLLSGRRVKGAIVLNPRL